MSLYDYIGEIIISSEEIHHKIEELGREISQDYRLKEPILICNLKGAFRFLADLCSVLTIPVRIDFIAIASYNGETAGSIRIIKDLKLNIKGKDVLIVEDIVDRGLTLSYMIDYLNFHKPNSLKVCALLDKKQNRQVEVKLDYTGFEIPNRFVIGYGLDYKEYFRELDYIAVMKEEITNKPTN